MKITFVSLFEELIRPYFEHSVLGIAHRKGLFEFDFLNPRDFVTNAHKKVDDTKIGGGAGMLMACEGLFGALETIKGARVILASPVGKPFLQKDAIRLSEYSHIAFVCGRYEGIDERFTESLVHEVFCVGDFVLSGGELASLSMSDAILRNVDGVLGNQDSLIEESFNNGLLEAPAFTKPYVFNKKSAISELLKGNHSKIRTLNEKLSLLKTQYFRPKG